MLLSCFAVAAGISPSARVAAQDVDAESAEKYTEAVPIERRTPRYPQGATFVGREGWVIVSYIVAADGGVIEPMIEDSSGGEVFETAALRAVEEWRFEPATSNGEPVEQSMTQARIVFQMQESAKSVGREFLRRYTAIQEGIVAGNLAEAEGLLTELQYDEKFNLAEDAWFWWLKFMYLEAAGSTDTEEKISSLRRALGYQVEYLPSNVFVGAAQRLYALEVQAFDLSGAIDTFERLRDSEVARKSDAYEPALMALQPSYQEILDLVAGPRMLAFDARIGAHDYWVHDLLRRSFSLANVQGSVEVVDVRCSRGNRRYRSFAEGSIWIVPSSWGECGIYIGGDEGTTFTFNEHPDDSASSEAAAPE